jgi:CHASE3 domain sensor protein
VARGTVYFQRAGAVVIIVMVLAVISGLSFLSVSYSEQNSTNKCQDRYFLHLTSVLRVRSSLSDEQTRDQEALNKALLGHPVTSSQSTVARANYQAQLDKIDQARRQNPIPPVPGC